MSSLVEIYLFSNELEGDLPVYIGSRFAEVISIGHNRFSATIPESFSTLMRLRVFSAEHEDPNTLEPGEQSSSKTYGLVGPLPAFDRTPNLRELYLSGNGLGGAIPSTFLDGVQDTGAPMHIDISSVRCFLSIARILRFYLSKSFASFVGTEFPWWCYPFTTGSIRRHATSSFEQYYY